MSKFDGKEMYAFASEIYNINRCLTGEGNRQTLRKIKGINPSLQNLRFESGSKVFDWTIPYEWRVNNATLKSPTGEIIADYFSNNLSVVQYSKKKKSSLKLEDLTAHIHTLPDRPIATPYVTSYYGEDWGFCLPHAVFEKLSNGFYEVDIDVEFIKGFLDIGEIVIEGQIKKEIVFSTYICHPAMANNEVSGITVSTFLANWLKNEFENNYYTYRFLFLPETIGSIAYISANLSHLKENMIAGYVLTCIGDEREYSYLSTRTSSGYCDAVAELAMTEVDKNFKRYDWSERGSDERQFCSPGVDLPFGVIMRSKFGTYPEYHTSDDNLGDVVTQKGLFESLSLMKNIVTIFENDLLFESKIPCEPMLSKHGLYPTISTKGTVKKVQMIRDIIGYADGKNSLGSISYRFGHSIVELRSLLKQIEEKGLVETKRLHHD